MDLEILIATLVVLTIIFNAIVDFSRKKAINKFIKETSDEELYEIKNTFDNWLHRYVIKNQKVEKKGSYCFVLDALEEDIPCCPFRADSIEMMFLNSRYKIKAEQDHNSSIMDVHYYTIPNNYIRSSNPNLRNNLKKLKNKNLNYV